MNSLDILKVFERVKGEFAFVATYDFDPKFFENRVLHTKGFGNAKAILVLMDSRRYADLLKRGLEGDLFNRRYLVVPTRHSPGVFHPKLYLILGETSAVGMLGSSNCTSAGLAYNLELNSTFWAETTSETALNKPSANILRKIYSAFRSFSERNLAVSGCVEDRIYAEAETANSWLTQAEEETSFAKGLAFLNSLDAPIIEQARDRLVSEKVDRISILSPFFDRGLQTISQLANEWPKAQIEVVAQPKYTRLPTTTLTSIFAEEVNGRLLSATTPPGRRLHAKALAFRTDAGTFWVTGSANATRFGLGGVNTETGLSFFSDLPFESIFDDQQIELVEVEPIDFEPGEMDEPGEDSLEAHSKEINLRSVVLSEDGQLALEARVDKNVSNLRLSITNVREETMSLSLRVSFAETGKCQIALEPTQVDMLERAAVCELMGNSAEEPLRSNPVALVQIGKILQERGGLGAPGNPLNRISETGEGLSKYVDALGGVGEVIDFYKRTNIRFFDNPKKHTGGRGPKFQQRDPYTPDTRFGWEHLMTVNDSEELCESIREFVKRHQKQKLARHVKRGNLNGLSNFLDIFRTLNSELLKWHSRLSSDGQPIVPFGQALKPILDNIELLIGRSSEKSETGGGFIGAIRRNLRMEDELVSTRLDELQVATMVRAAIEAALDVREVALGLKQRDRWAVEQLKWVNQWTIDNSLARPTAADIEAALQEYRPFGQAA